MFGAGRLKLLLIVCVGIALIGGLIAGIRMRTGINHSVQPSSVPHIVAPTPRPFEFPAGGRQLEDAYRMVALYGTPDTPVLGALGQQSLPKTIDRVKKLASHYDTLSTEPVLPTLEIISTIASASPTENGDYSREVDMAKLRTWVMTAQKAGVYVVLDLQPGRTNFLVQAKMLEPLLREPNVGLALDPEWRLGRKEFPLVQIGAVNIKEVNSVVRWLAALTKRHNLPQKAFVLHQFRLSMLPQRSLLDTSHKELTYIVQMDGQGSQSSKKDTWQTVAANPSPRMVFGWKNFYRKDPHMLSIRGTMQITPLPRYISYQ